MNQASLPAPAALLTIDAAIRDAIMALPPDERHDRDKVNGAVREGLRLGPLRPAGSEDLYGVPKATIEAARETKRPTANLIAAGTMVVCA